MATSSASVDRPAATLRGVTVLQVVPALDAGGVERTTVDVARAIVAGGGRAIVASRGGRLADELTAAGGSMRTMRAASKNPLRIAANAFELARIIRREGVDLIHARSRAPAWSALIAARMCNVPFVTTYHGAYGQGGGLGGRVKGLYNGVMARGDRVIANSGFTRDLILARHAPDASRVHVIHRGTDLARFDPARLAPGAIEARRRDWGARPGERILLLPARLTAWKGHRVLIEAARSTSRRAEAPPVRLVFIGDPQGRDAYVADLKARAEAAGIALVMPGHDADMPSAYAAADVVVVPSTEPEAFGRTAVEAQAMGRPVLVSDHGATPETVIIDPAEARTGFRTPPGDAGALAEAVLETLSMTPAAREAMGLRARANAARFGLSRMTDETLAVYAALVG